jgi:hypothetical protein
VLSPAATRYCDKVLRMKTDRYIKTVLTVIAIMLALIAARPLISPDTISAQTSFAGVQFATQGATFTFFDSRTGEVWRYNTENGAPMNRWQITKLGAPLSVKNR